MFCNDVSANTVSDDPCSVVEHTKALIDAMKKAKLRDTVLGPLMKSTFQVRRVFIMMLLLWQRSYYILPLTLLHYTYATVTPTHFLTWHAM